MVQFRFKQPTTVKLVTLPENVTNVDKSTESSNRKLHQTKTRTIIVFCSIVCNVGVQLTKTMMTSRDHCCRVNMTGHK